nr:SlyX family protein [Henriciella sp.]
MTSRPTAPYIAAMTDTSSTSSRLDELEIRIAHQDQTIEDLNAAITAQWKLIDRLERQVVRLAERVADSEQAVSEAAPVNRPPPHY